MMGLSSSRNTVLNEIDDTKPFMKANNTYTQYIFSTDFTQEIDPTFLQLPILQILI